jgi:hypothetical protein
MSNLGMHYKQTISPMIRPHICSLWTSIARVLTIRRAHSVLRLRAVYILPILLLGVVLVGGVSCTTLGFKVADYNPQIVPADFRDVVDNPYFPLKPGTMMKYIVNEKGETSDNYMEITHDTKTVMGVKCVVLRDTVLKNGVLREESWNWYAQDKEGAVWYFGEDSKEFNDSGSLVSTLGSWEAGVKGALPGIVMPGQPKIGQPAYRQEYYRGEAEDMGQVAALDDEVTVPFGTFKGCLKTNEWSMLESDTENKWYAKDIGWVKSVTMSGEVSELVSMTQK